MKTLKTILPRAAVLLLMFTLVCGLLYTGVITGFAQLIFPQSANGSMIKVNGKSYGSALLGQQYTDDAHLWGRIMKLDVASFTAPDGTPRMYAVPSNLSPASAEYAVLVAQRVEKIRAAHPEKMQQPIPVDLVTGSGSGLDPHISPAAAQYQAQRIARENNMTPQQVQEMIEKCSEGRFLGIFGEPTVNVLEFNLMLDGVL